MPDKRSRIGEVALKRSHNQHRTMYLVPIGTVFFLSLKKEGARVSAYIPDLDGEVDPLSGLLHCLILISSSGRGEKATYPVSLSVKQRRGLLDDLSIRLCF